jgi:hypothetical protein
MLAVLKPWAAWTPNVPPWRRPPATTRYRTDKRCVEAYCWLDQDSVLHWNVWSGARGWTAQQWAIFQGMMSHPSPDELEDDHVPVDLGGSSFAVTRRTPKNPNSKKALGMMSSWTMTTQPCTRYTCVRRMAPSRTRPKWCASAYSSTVDSKFSGSIAKSRRLKVGWRRCGGKLGKIEVELKAKV